MDALSLTRLARDDSILMGDDQHRSHGMRAYSSAAERTAHNCLVAGSNPAGPTLMMARLRLLAAGLAINVFLPFQEECGNGFL